MKKVTLVITEELANALGVSNAADDTAIAGAIKTMADRAKLADEYKNKYDTAKSEKEKAENDLANFKAEQSDKEVKELLDAAQEAKTLTNEDRKSLEEEYKGRPENLKRVLAMLKPQTVIKNSLNEGGGDEGKDTAALKAEFEKLDKSGELANVAKNEPERYKTLYKAKYGVEPKNIPGKK